MEPPGQVAKGRDYPRGFLLLFILGLVLTSSGLLLLLAYATDSRNHLTGISTNIVVGWSPDQQNQVQIDNLEVGIVPSPGGSGTSSLTINVQGTDYTNRTFVFGFLSPFDVTKDPAYQMGNWTVQSFGSLGSAIYLTYNLNSSLRSGFITSGASFFIKNPLYEDNHGTYTVYFPFSGSLGLQFQQAWEAARGNLTFPLIGSPNIAFNAYIPLDDPVVSSFPAFNSVTVSIPNNPAIAEEQGLYFPLNRSTGVSITYQNPSEVQWNESAEAVGILLTSVGIPVLIAILVERYKWQLNLPRERAGVVPILEARDSASRFWLTKNSEIKLVLGWGVLIDVGTIIAAIIPVISGIGGIAAILIALLFSLGLPVLVARRVGRQWSEESERIADLHPYHFLSKVRAIKRNGYVLELSVVVVGTFLVLEQANLVALLAGLSIISALVLMFPIELILLVVFLNFWEPRAFIALRAAIRSEFDHERGTKLSWLDDSVRYYNVLASKLTGLVVKRNLSVQALLFGSPLKDVHVGELLHSVETADYSEFLGTLATLSGHKVHEIVNRSGTINSFLNDPLPTLTGLSIVIPIVVAGLPYVGPFLINPMIKEWTQLLHSAQWCLPLAG